MKMHISVDQLNELSPAAKERLRAWWKPEEGDWIVHLAVHDVYGDGFDKPCNEEMLLHTDNDEGGWVGNSYSHRICIDQAERSARWYGTQIKEYAPLLSISQMLDYLVEHEPDHFHGLSRDAQGIFAVVWDSEDERFTANARFAGDPRGGSPITHIRYREGDELVDTLWFVVSTILAHEPKI